MNVLPSSSKMDSFDERKGDFHTVKENQPLRSEKLVKNATVFQYSTACYLASKMIRLVNEKDIFTKSKMIILCVLKNWWKMLQFFDRITLVIAFEK